MNIVGLFLKGLKYVFIMINLFEPTDQFLRYQYTYLYIPISDLNN